MGAEQSIAGRPRACRDLVLGQLGFDRVVSIVAPENLRSRRVAEQVHQSMREFVWERNGRSMCLFESIAATT